MKALVNSMLIAVLIIAVSGCAEEAAVQNDPLRFNFKVNSGRNSTSELPPGTSLLVTLQNASGEEVYTLKNIPFEKNTDGYITAALDLAPGTYNVTEFLLVDANEEIQYAIPVAKSPLKELFVPSQSGDINAEVFDVKRFNPADFGLSAFSLRNSFQVEVTDDDGAPVPADIVVFSGEDTVAHFNTMTKKRRVAFNGDLSGTYKLVVSSEDMTPYVAEGTLGEWITEFRSIPLRIQLARAFTMTAEADGDLESPFSFYVGGESMNISVNWGDGNVESYSINDPYGVEIAHNYAAAGSYPVTITGDLRKIVHFYSFYGIGDFSRISFRNVPNLRELLFGLTSGPATLDLSRNNKLEQAMLPGMRSLQNLILPETHNLVFLEVDGENGLDSNDINAIIQNIYTNTSASGRREGVFGVRGTWYQDEGDMTMIGPPSAESIELLNSLRNDFGWYVHPSEADPAGRMRSSDLKANLESRIAARKRI
jgi:hypothetical protein